MATMATRGLWRTGPSSKKEGLCPARCNLANVTACVLTMTDVLWMDISWNHVYDDLDTHLARWIV
jgi:hypothetical protein